LVAASGGEWIILTAERVVRLLPLAIAVLALFPATGSVFAVRTLGSNAFWPVAAAAGRQADPTSLGWSEYFGYWRLDPGIAIGPKEPFRLQITVDGDELHIERHGFSITEVSRYRLDGVASMTVQNGGAVEAAAVLEPRGMVIRTRMPLPGGRVSNVTEVFSVQRRFVALLTIERTTVVGTRTTVTTDLLRRLPMPRPLHPDNQP
jgi:hypothetical protein